MHQFEVIIWLKNRETPIRVPVQASYHDYVESDKAISALSSAITNIVSSAKVLSLGENHSFNIIVSEIQAFSIVRGL